MTHPCIVGSMPVIVTTRDGRILTNATVQIPVDLRDFAHESGISMSKTLREALYAEKSRRDGES